MQKYGNLSPPPSPSPVKGEEIFDFLRDHHIYTEEYLQTLGLNERQIKAVIYVKQKGKIANREYREMFNIKNRMALIELSDLCDKRILIRVGKTGRATEYILIGQTRNKPAINPQ